MVEIKRNDRIPAVKVTLKDEAGMPVNLTGATVTFVMKTTVDAATPTVSGAATLVDAANGVVEYAWAVGDTATAGSYISEFEVVYSSGLPQTFPTEGFLPITIHPDLGGTV